jgi:hypothetical protein
MAYRKKMSRKASRKNFTKNAMRVKGKNYAMPMRGGYRL